MQNAMKHTLWSLKAGQRCEILGFDQALADNYRTRMMEFGFHPGETVSCVQALAFGAPKVYRVSNTIFSLDEEVAAHLQVRLLADNE
ncbi:MAG: ferrous iron transport protein A [Halieaceae bacterium]|nr:ferrous iron transport protein A [Halieaceae bacterium]